MPQKNIPIDMFTVLTVMESTDIATQSVVHVHYAKRVGALVIYLYKL